MGNCIASNKELLYKPVIWFYRQVEYDRIPIPDAWAGIVDSQVVHHLRATPIVENSTWKIVFGLLGLALKY
jgi:hypothetical protein